MKVQAALLREVPGKRKVNEVELDVPTLRQVPAQVLATCLGTSTGAVRNRAGSTDGTLTADLVQRLTGLTPRELDRLSGGHLSGASDTSTDPETYRIIDVLRALLRTPYERA